MHPCMDWRAVDFDWNRARAFLVTAEEGSFSAAARALAVAQPTIGRQVAALEEELGVALFERVGNNLELTEAGLDLLAHVRVMGEAAMRVSVAATGQAEAIAGNVVITASDVIGATLLAPIVGELRVAHPAIEIELVASNAIQDLRRREADIALRNVPPTQPELIGRKLRDSQVRPYASPAYLERIGAADLSRCSFIGYERSNVMVDYLGRLGLSVTQADFPVVTENLYVQLSLARQGVGVIFVMEEAGDADPALVRVTDDFSFPIPLWLVSHRELRTSRRIRLVWDAIVAAIR